MLFVNASLVVCLYMLVGYIVTVAAGRASRLKIRKSAWLVLFCLSCVWLLQSADQLVVIQSMFSIDVVKYSGANQRC